LAPSEKFEQWRPARCVREAWAWTRAYASFKKIYPLM
jgi:hypothetical protein